MAFGAENFILLAAVLAFVFTKSSTLTVTRTTNFESYGPVIAKLPIITDRLRILHAVWGELQVDGAQNLEHVKSFYDNLLKYTAGAINADAEEAAELAAEVRNVLVTVNGRLLAETLNHNDSQTVSSVKSYRTQLLKTYTIDLASAIFEHAIDAAYPYKDTDLLHAELNDIDISPTNANVYRLRANWNLYLYNKFLQRGDINDKYVYQAALALRNLKYGTFYNTLSNNTIRRIDAAFAGFPSSLGVLFNSTTVCLENVNIRNYFLYFAESTATTASNFVPAVIRNRYDFRANDRLVWTNSFADRNLAAPTSMYLRLKSNSWYIYRQTSSPAVLVQRTDNNAALRTWVPSLMKDAIMFQQNGFYMCATQQFVGELLGFAVHSLSNIKPQDANCQWILTDCARL